MKIRVLSSKNYKNNDKNYGDCIIIDTGLKTIIYDCGSEEHAVEVERYLDKNWIIIYLGKILFNISVIII